MLKKRSKFNVDTSGKGKDKRTYDGILFDSEMEMKYYRDYLLFEKECGNIIDIKVHPRYILQESYVKNGKKILPIFYELDFEYVTSSGETFLIDIKGMELSDAKLKRKIFDYKYPDKNLKWIAYSRLDGGWVETDKIKKGRSQRKKSKE
jgi:hypothetical protein